MLISLFIEKVDIFFDVFFSAYWKFCEISTLTKDIKSAVVLHQYPWIVPSHHREDSDRRVLHQLVIYKRGSQRIQGIWLI